VNQFADDSCANGGVFFYKFCDHCMDFTRLNTVIDHMQVEEAFKQKDVKSKTVY